MAIRILYVEDNYQNYRLVTRMLGPRGFEVIGAEDGLTGLKMAHEQHPDLILMDLNLPGIDGLEATRQLKAAQDTASIPIVALTAKAMHGDREQGLDAGCDGYLQKPISTTGLLDAINRFVLEPRAQAETTGTATPATKR
jgi:two-component system cell cycle response regulator DivK